MTSQDLGPAEPEPVQKENGESPRRFLWRFNGGRTNSTSVDNKMALGIIFKPVAEGQLKARTDGRCAGCLKMLADEKTRRSLEPASNGRGE